ncbi:helix-turn-helix domain-containing protein [Megasphaera elsdenii]|uniref:helix-turn-helix domain-containing protein n=1 Tax=Megasphaera elsdenii TaxID=907 RepID=UPI00242B72AE|nr:XRE family transcriptional regulator [Megasphaera elsdenii]
MTSGQRITKLRKERDLQQKEVAAAIGMNRIVLNRIELGKRPLRDDEAVALADFFHVTTDYLLKGVTAQPRDKKGVRIPVLGRVVAGIPIEAVEEILDYEEITPELAATGEFFALQVKGDSMLPKLEEGDVVIVKKQADVETGDIAIVLVNGDEATIKQVKKVNGGIMLYGFNPDVYEPHFYSNQQIEELPVRILGKVIESRRSW